ncbi:hypothetical protein Taro_057002 [Colocasia esculenta]|uniref:Glycosyltransferase n=1 Tax=Colocasia esculenta TaxID=4460 RepID=A0A843XY42_COLES|nr:hypothetical protein [Colocasia esculenta]
MAPFRVFFTPFFVPSHTIPIADLACQFAARGVDSTVVVTPGNGAVIQRSVDRASRAGLPVRTLHYSFPSAEAGLPEGVENAGAVLTGDVSKVYATTDAVRGCHDRIFREHRPDAVVADFLFGWTIDTTRDLGIPLVFVHVIGAFPVMAMARVYQHWPQAQVAGGDRNGRFVVPHLPDRVEMVRSELPSNLMDRNATHVENLEKRIKAQRECFGVILNTFYELEPAYCDLYRTMDCRRAWYVGPCTLWPKDGQEEEEAATAAKGHHCVSWLDKQATESVVYVGFGSLLHFGKQQHWEMAWGLEASGRPFLWVLKESDFTGDGEGSLPEGFEERVRGRGLVVRGWVPQAAILHHRATGAFVTHLGWNSLNEGLHAGLPMITWPLAFEQFLTERLVVDILQVGVKMWDGFRSSVPASDDAQRALVSGEAISRVVGQFSPGEKEVEGMRKRAKEYGAMIRAAVRESGSSYRELTDLIDGLKAYRPYGGRMAPIDR